MANNYGIPAAVEQKIRTRDKTCEYCRKKMLKGHPKKGPTIEHLNNVIHLVPTDCAKDCNTIQTLAICCNSCNTSRGNKHYWIWFDKEYCIKNDINKRTVANVVKQYIKKYPKIRKFSN